MYIIYVAGRRYEFESYGGAELAVSTNLRYGIDAFFAGQKVA
jgi:hypothetical protein